MKYNKGDIVIIKSLKWYNLNKSFDDSCRGGQHSFSPEMKVYCGKKTKVTECVGNHYYLDIAGDRWVFQDYMLDDLRTVRRIKLKKIKKSQII